MMERRRGEWKMGRRAIQSSGSRAEKSHQRQKGREKRAKEQCNGIVRRKEGNREMEWARGRTSRGDALPDCSCIQQQTDCLTATLQVRVPKSQPLCPSILCRQTAFWHMNMAEAQPNCGTKHPCPGPGLQHCELFCSLQLDSMNEMPPLFIEPNCKFSQCRGKAKEGKDRGDNESNLH